MPEKKDWQEIEWRLHADNVQQAFSTLYQYDHSQGVVHEEGEQTPEQAFRSLEAARKYLAMEAKTTIEKLSFALQYRMLEYKTGEATAGFEYRQKQQLPGLAVQLQAARTSMVNGDSAFYTWFEHLSSQADGVELAKRLRAEMDLMEGIDQENGFKDLDKLPEIIRSIVYTDRSLSANEMIGQLNAIEDAAHRVVVSQELAQVQERPEVITSALESLESAHTELVRGYAVRVEYDAIGDGDADVLPLEFRARRAADAIKAENSSNTVERLHTTIEWLCAIAKLDPQQVMAEELDESPIQLEIAGFGRVIKAYEERLARFDSRDITYVEVELANHREMELKRNEHQEIADLLMRREPLIRLLDEAEMKLKYIPVLRQLKEQYLTETHHEPFTSLIKSPESKQEE